MDILYFQGVRPFRLVGGAIMDIVTSKGYDLLGWEELEKGTISEKGIHQLTVMGIY